MPRAIPLTKEEELTSRKWRIHTDDEKTLAVLEKILKDFVQGPIKKVPLTHRLYNDKARMTYEVPYALVDFFIKNRTNGIFIFDSFFKKYSTKPFVLYKEEGGLPRETLQRTFGGSLSVTG